MKTMLHRVLDQAGLPYLRSDGGGGDVASYWFVLGAAVSMFAGPGLALCSWIGAVLLGLFVAPGQRCWVAMPFVLGALPAGWWFLAIWAGAAVVRHREWLALWLHLLPQLGLPYLSEPASRGFLLRYWCWICLIMGLLRGYQNSVFVSGALFSGGVVGLTVTLSEVTFEGRYPIIGLLPLLAVGALDLWCTLFVLWPGAALAVHWATVRSRLLFLYLQWRRPADTAVVVGETLRISYRHGGQEHTVYVPYQPRHRLRDVREQLDLQPSAGDPVAIRQQPGVPLLVTGRQLGGILSWTASGAERRTLGPDETVEMARVAPVVEG